MNCCQFVTRPRLDVRLWLSLPHPRRLANLTWTVPHTIILATRLHVTDTTHLSLSFVEA